MKIQKIIFLNILLLGSIFVTACGSTPKVDWKVTISGEVARPQVVTYSELADMPQNELKDILMNKSVGEDQVGSWSGVLLADLLEKAGAADDFSTIMAVAVDGYAIEIIRDELETAIVALKEEGEWIHTADPDHGPIRLVCPQTPANRWVFQLVEIQVNK